MLLKGDASKLEWVVKVWQAQDPVAMKEILTGFDIHTDNQKTFSLPNRTIAKNFVYQMIFADAFGEKGFRGPAYSYANNANYQEASASPKFWEGVIEKFFNKYPDIYQHSINMIREAVTTGQITACTGRFYNFAPVQKYGGMDWPRSDILNYPIQGLANDMMALVRIGLSKSLEEYPTEEILLINTVHDDVEIDVANDPEVVYNICCAVENAFANIPTAFEATYGVKVNLPFSGEVKMGWSLYEKEMVKFNRKAFEEDWRKLYGSNPNQRN
jgi:hypothetical protein